MSQLCKTEPCLPGKAYKGKHWLTRKQESCFLKSHFPQMELLTISLPNRAALATFTGCQQEQRERQSQPCSLYFLSLKLFCAIILCFYYCCCVVFCHSLFSWKTLKISEGQPSHTQGCIIKQKNDFSLNISAKEDCPFQVLGGCELGPVAVPLSRLHLQLLRWNPPEFRQHCF